MTFFSSSPCNTIRRMSPLDTLYAARQEGGRKCVADAARHEHSIRGIPASRPQAASEAHTSPPSWAAPGGASPPPLQPAGGPDPTSDPLSYMAFWTSRLLSHATNARWLPESYRTHKRYGACATAGSAVTAPHVCVVLLANYAAQTVQTTWVSYDRARAALPLPLTIRMSARR